EERGVEAHGRQDARPRQHLVLLRRKREQDLALQVGVPLQGDLHRLFQRQRLRRRRWRLFLCNGGSREHQRTEQDPRHYFPPPIATASKSRRQTQPQSVPISARFTGTSPAAATPNPISTAAQSEKKSSAFPSFSAAAASGWPSAAAIALTVRGASGAGPAGSAAWRSAVIPSSRFPIAPGSSAAAATGKTARPLTRPRRNHTRTTTARAPVRRKNGASAAPPATRITWNLRSLSWVSSSMARSLIEVSWPALSSASSVAERASTRPACESAAKSAQPMAMR